MRYKKRALAAVIATALVAALMTTTGGSANADTDPGGDQSEVFELGHDGIDLDTLDSSNSNVLPASVSAASSNSIELEGRGVRNVADATTDVYALGDYAYTGTFNAPCGGDAGAGIWVWDVEDSENPSFVTVIPSPDNSRTNDVRVASMNSGDILVHSNESCAAEGPGGFEIYDIDDPTNPIALAGVRIDEPNAVASSLFAGVVDVGVHNLFLFTQGTNDYVAVTAETVFGNFQIFDITDPSAPSLVSLWGAEKLFDPGITENTANFDRVLAAVLDLLDGYGASQNKFLHDATISADGTMAYLANWDAGLVLLDISKPDKPRVVSVAIDPVNGSLDGEVNSHAVWPSEDGAIVVEGEEDFSAWEAAVAPTNLRFSDDNLIPGVSTGTGSGDTMQTGLSASTGTLTVSELTIDSGGLAGSVFPVAELSSNAMPLLAGSVSGAVEYIGQACNADPVPTVTLGAIAIARRGACTFSEKSINAEAAGAGAVVIANNQPSTPWSGLRIWDYSNPRRPVLASTFNTVCSASVAPGGTCAENGTYSVHNVQVETVEGHTLAFVSWYFDGMLIIDVTDPYNPVEIARYLDTSGPNDGLANDFWGVYKEAGSDTLYASDRNGGLYIFDIDDIVEDHDDDDHDDDDHDDDDHDDDDHEEDDHEEDDHEEDDD